MKVPKRKATKDLRCAFCYIQTAAVTILARPCCTACAEKGWKQAVDDAELHKTEADT